MIVRILRTVVSSAFVAMALASASGASAQEEGTQIRPEGPIGPNEVLDFQAGPVSVHAETSLVGATVSTTVPINSLAEYAVDIVLSCTDGNVIFNDLVYTSGSSVATQDCDPGGELFLAEVSIHLKD